LDNESDIKPMVSQDTVPLVIKSVPVEEQMKELTKRVKEVAEKAGAHLVGIAPVKRFAEAPEGHKPNDLLKKAESVISLACVIPYGTAITAPSFSYITYGFNLLEQKLHEISFAVAWFLEEEGFISLPLQTSSDIVSVKIIEESPEPQVIRMGLFSHRHAAVEAGLGEIGANSALVTPQYGSRVRLGSVITAAKLTPDSKLTEKVCDPRKCGYRCVKACPYDALPGDGTINQYRCMAGRLRDVGEPYDLNMFKEYASVHYLIRRRKVTITYPVCGRCVVCCPMGRLQSKPSHDF